MTSISQNLSMWRGAADGGCKLHDDRRLHGRPGRRTADKPQGAVRLTAQTAPEGGSVHLARATPSNRQKRRLVLAYR